MSKPTTVSNTDAMQEQRLPLTVENHPAKAMALGRAQVLMAKLDNDPELLRQGEELIAQAQAVLARQSDILGRGGRLGITQEQEQKLLPVLTRVMDAAFRLGYYKFKDAARFVLDTIRAKLGGEAADQITLDHLQGAYIGMSGKYRDQGASTKREVIEVESLDELKAEQAPAPPAPSPDAEHDAGLRRTADDSDDTAAQAAGFAVKKGLTNEWGTKVEYGGERDRVALLYTLRRVGGKEALGPRRYALSVSPTFPGSGVTGAPSILVGLFDTMDVALAKFAEDTEIRQGKKVDPGMASVLSLMGLSDQEIAAMPNAQRIAMVREVEEKARAVQFVNAAPPRGASALYIGTGEDGAMYTLRSTRRQATG